MRRFLRLVFHPGGWFLIFAIFAVLSANRAFADYDQRLSLGVGIAQVSSANQAGLMVGAEYEKRLDAFLGLGGGAEYVFLNPGVAYVAVPDVFVHPFGSEFLVSAAPLLEFGSQVGTNVGAQLGTRIPIPLGPISIVPSFDIGLISGGPIYTLGFGIEF